MMMKQGDIAQCLWHHLSETAQNVPVEDVRIGLGYAGVRLAGERLGVAAILRHELEAGCTTIDQAGTLTSLGAVQLLRHLIDGRNPLDKALGLATANALISPDAEQEEKDTLEMIHLTPHDRVAMVGFFGPLIAKIRDTGAKLSIIERDSRRTEVSDEQTKERILEECTVAIITATALVTNTLEEILNSLGTPRHVAVIGPSTPLCKEAFEGTPVTHLGGSAIVDIPKILQIISEGGGTPAMRPYLRFVNILLRG